MEINLLHTNDLHGRLPLVGSSLAAIRDKFDLYLDSGDAVSFGNVSIPLREDPAWGWFRQLRCDAGAIGNRESHYQPGLLQKKLAGAGHPLLCANLFRRDGTRILPASAVLKRNGIRIGLVGAMLEMTPRYQKLAGIPIGELAMIHWEQAEPIVKEEGDRLRAECDLLIFLSHLGLRRDRDLAKNGCPFDVILGGHSHDILEKPEKAGRAWICQGGSHGFKAGAYKLSDGALTGGLITLRNRDKTEPEPVMDQVRALGF